MNKYLKILIITAITLIFTFSIVTGAEVNFQDNPVKVDAKQVKKVDKKFKILKTTKDKQIIQINGKNQTLKRYYVKGKYAPKYLYANKNLIVVKGAYCSCGKHKWKQNKLIVFENDVKFLKGKSIPRGKNYKLYFNRKGVPEGEFNVWNKGTRYHHMDFCMFCGNDKASKGKKKYYMKILN